MPKTMPNFSRFLILALLGYYWIIRCCCVISIVILALSSPNLKLVFCVVKERQNNSTMFITLLPNELITLIIKNIDCRDIVNFSSTCKGFNTLIKNNEYLWKEKFKQLMPQKMFHIVSTLSTNGSWFQEIQFFYTIRKKIYAELLSMSSKYYGLVEEKIMQDETSMIKIALSNNVTYFYTIHILREFIGKANQFVNENQCIMPYTLTEIYYAKLVLQYLTYAFLSVKWVQMFMKKELTPESVLCIFLQWTDYNNVHSDEELEMKISGIVKDVELLLLKNNTATETSALELHEKVAKKIINKKELLQAISEVIYRQRGMQVATSSSIETFDMEKVLIHNCGNAIAVAITYYYVAKRCGVICDVVHFPYHFFLEWRDTTIERKPQSYSLDIYTGELRQQRSCPFGGTRQLDTYRYCPAQLLRYIVNAYVKMLGTPKQRVLHDTVQLCFLVDNISANNTYSQYRRFLDNEKSLMSLPTINLHYIQDEHLHIISNLTNLTKSPCPPANLVTKIRNSHVKYAVGMICYHKTHNYDCVIVGWDTKCDKNWFEPTINQVLELGINQPFYTIVCDDQSKRYIAQENLSHITNPSRPQHFEDIISRYFTHFNGFAYEPNNECRQEYPDDLNISNLFRDRAENIMGLEF